MSNAGMWPALADALGLVREPLPATGAQARLVSLGASPDEAGALIACASREGLGVLSPRPGRAGLAVVAVAHGLEILHSRESASPQTMALHELANAMTVVVGLAERASSEGGPRDARDERIDRIARTARDGMHVARLVERSDAEASERRVTARGDAAATLARVVDGLRPFAGRREVRLCPELSPCGSVEDEHALAAIAWNLVKNAIEASPPGSQVVVHCVARGGALEVAVLDEGGGLEARPRKRRGRGVGLTVTRTLLEALAGALELEARTPRGTLARVRMPVRPDEELSSPPAPRSGVGGPRARILVIEDDPALRRLMSERLGELGWLVHAAADPFSVLTATSVFDLALVDLHLDGERISPTLLRALRERARVIVAVTGDPDVSLAVDCVLRKPFDLDELGELVERLACPAEHEQQAR